MSESQQTRFDTAHLTKPICKLAYLNVLRGKEALLALDFDASRRLPGHHLVRNVNLGLNAGGGTRLFDPTSK